MKFIFCICKKHSLLGLIEIRFDGNHNWLTKHKEWMPEAKMLFVVDLCVWRLSLIWSDLIHNRWWPTDQQLRHEWQRFRPFTITMPFWFFLSLLPKRPTHTFNRVLSRKLLSYSSKRKTCFFFQSIDQNLKFKIEKYKKKRFTFKQTNKLTVWVYNKDILQF